MYKGVILIFTIYILVISPLYYFIYKIILENSRKKESVYFLCSLFNYLILIPIILFNIIIDSNNYYIYQETSFNEKMIMSTMLIHFISSAIVFNKHITFIDKIHHFVFFLISLFFLLVNYVPIITLYFFVQQASAISYNIINYMKLRKIKLNKIIYFVDFISFFIFRVVLQVISLYLFSRYIFEKGIFIYNLIIMVTFILSLILNTYWFCLQIKKVRSIILKSLH